MKPIAVCVFFFLLVFGTSAAQADTFGSIDIDFVTIGNPGNADDDDSGTPDPVGKVDYIYRISTYEISRDMINHANADGGLGITLADMSSLGGNGADRPATGINWFEAARFVNWLNTDSGSTPAYKFNGSTFELWSAGDSGYNPDNLFRNSEAKYFLPSADEWYKAAFYNPDTGSYGDYPTANGLLPTAVASGTTANTAVYGGTGIANGPADITQAGGLSPYGTMAQGGNVAEWEESSFDLLNNSSSSARGNRGGFWLNPAFSLSSSWRNGSNPALSESSFLGFRVASIPEPSTALLGILTTVGLLLRRRR